MSFKLGKFNSVPIIIHWSFSLLLVGVVIGVSIAYDITTAILYGIGAITLFGSVLIHEFMHSAMAKRFGYPTEEIVLYPLGGMSKIEEIPTNPKQEFLIAFSGPVSNFVIAGIVYGISFLIEPLDITFLERSFYDLVVLYALLNIGLGLFNLLVPAIPMDGGRLLRSLLAMKMPFPKATEIAVQVSKIIAIIMGMIGFFTNIWLVFIAFFVYIASTSEMEESLTRYLLEDVKISQIMQADISSVDNDLTTSQLLDKMIEESQLAYLVQDKEGNYLGEVNLGNIRNVAPEHRSSITVDEIYNSHIHTISKENTAKDALKALKSEEIGKLYVKANGDIVGMVTRSNLMKFIRVKSVKSQIDTDRNLKDTQFKT